MDAFTPSPLRNVVINEFLAHTDPPDYDYIELYNHSTVERGYFRLHPDRRPGHQQIRGSCPARLFRRAGFVFYSETNMNFALNAVGEAIYF